MKLNTYFESSVGWFTQQFDTALPRNHTKVLYESLKWNEASVIAQLRTGMARLNRYLHQIGAVDNKQCNCSQSKETVEHFLFRCSKWDAYRRDMPDMSVLLLRRESEG
jgi:hypothetical protein